MHCHPHSARSLWAWRQPGAWWERQINRGPLECLCVPSHHVLFSGRMTGCGGKSSSYAEQLSHCSQNARTEPRETESLLCGSSADQPAGLRAFWIRTVSTGQPECSGGPAGEVPGHCLTAVPSGLSPVTIPPIKCQQWHLPSLLYEKQLPLLQIRAWILPWHRQLLSTKLTLPFHSAQL